MAKQVRGIWRLAAHELPEIVAEQGLLWIKLCSINERRLIMQLAKDGWRHPDDSSDEEDVASVNDGSSVDDEDKLPILKAAQKLVSLAQDCPVDYRHPKVQLIFTKVEQGRIPQVDALINDIRALGVDVICKSDLGKVPPIEDALEAMLEPEKLRLSHTLNIDCTILLALVSDISHGLVAEQPWFNTAIRRQIQGEAKEPLLPEKLYPIINDHPLICTREAVTRMKDIVDLIGTDTEKQRTRILLAEEGHEGQMRDELIEEMQKLSMHNVSRQWKLPIKVVDAAYEGKLPAAALRIAADRESVKPSKKNASKKREEWTPERPLLSPLNQSVFFHGWANGLTTITSNRSVAKQIEARVYQYRSSEDEKGPGVWISSVTRSLLAKEKDRNNGYDRQSMADHEPAANETSKGADGEN